MMKCIVNGAFDSMCAAKIEEGSCDIGFEFVSDGYFQLFICTIQLFCFIIFREKFLQMYSNFLKHQNQSKKSDPTVTQMAMGTLYAHSNALLKIVIVLE